MPKPTDAEINRKAAQVALTWHVDDGYVIIEGHGISIKLSIYGYRIGSGWTAQQIFDAWAEDMFRPTQDRNALEPLLRKVEEEEKQTAFIRELGAILGTLPIEGKLARYVFQMMQANPAQQTEACLRALGAWEWD